MSAFADLMLALIPFAEIASSPAGRFPHFEAARDVLCEHAPCGPCVGTGKTVVTGHERFETGRGLETCAACHGAGWTPTSVEAAIKREEEERARLTNNALTAARDLVVTRDALDARRKAESNPDNREPGVPFEVDAAIDYLSDCMVTEL